MPLPLTKTFTIRKQAADLIDVRADIDLTAPATVAEMLDSRGRLPEALEEIRLADVQLAASTGDRAVTFGKGDAQVAFSAAAGPFGGMGAYRDQARMLADLAAAATGDAKMRMPLDEIPFPAVEAARYFVLYAGYGAAASANGSVALGPGAAATFGAQGGRRQAFAVIQAHAEEPRVDKAVRGLVDAWRLPSQVKTAEDVPAGTWIVAEVAGSLQANAGVTFGLDFNWVRSVKARELQGDIGLKIQAGAKAAFGLSLSDRYAVVVGRDSLDEADRRVRVRLHRLNERGWSFAASASLSAAGSTGKLLPAQMDDFLAATLGVHGMQTLEEVRRWTDPNRKASEVAADFLEELAKKRFGETLQRKSAEVRALAAEWFEKWDSLPARATSALWDIARLDNKQVEGFVSKIERLAAGDEEAVRAIVAEMVGQADFAATPAGMWLEAVAADRVMGVVASLPAAKAVSKAAARTLEILNGGLLTELKSYVEERVGLAPVRAAIANDDFQGLNEKLKAKLTEFLGVARLDSKAVQAIRDTVTGLDKRGGELYAAAVKALNETYRFTFDYACRETVTKTALLDVTFDFGVEQARPEALSELLQAAIAGDFRGALPPAGKKAPAGVSFREAALTHHMQRSSSVKITLPFFTSATVSQVSSLASFELAAEDGGVYLYALDAKDDVERAGKWRSTLSVGMSLAVGADSEVRRHDRGDVGATVDYHFERRLPGLRTAHFERLLDVLGPSYFPRELGGPLAPEKPSAHEWALALDKASDGGAAGRDDGLIGDSLLRLDVSLPGEAVTSWLRAPRDKDDALYMDLSRRVQSLLRRFIPFVYFQDLEKFRTLQSAYPLLVYAALPVTTSMRVESGRVLEMNTDRDVFWDWLDDQGARRALLSDSRTTLKLLGELAEASKALASEEETDLRRLTRRYAPAEIETVRKAVLGNPGKALLESLLANETSVIEGAVKAGVKLAKFREQAADPEKAIEALAEFGEKITKTFHRKLQTIFKPSEEADREALRNLGLLVFAEASGVFAPGAQVRPAARLELTVFKEGGEDVALRQALVEAALPG